MTLDEITRRLNVNRRAIQDRALGFSNIKSLSRKDESERSNQGDRREKIYDVPEFE